VVTPVPVPIDFNEVQGLIVRPFTHPVSCHLPVRFDTADGASKFLKALMPWVTSARPMVGAPPPRLLSVALSYKGLETAAALSPAALACLPGDFQSPPGPEDLGDDGLGPLWWDRDQAGQMHCLVSLWADGDATLTSFVGEVEGRAADAGVSVLRLRPDKGHIRGALFSKKRQLHFGYFDGISAPDVDWADTGAPDKVNYRNYLVGRGTEADRSSCLPLSGQGPALDEAAAFIRDGTFMVFRVMHQNVAAFNLFLETNARLLAPALKMSEADTAEWLAAKMLGRWRGGEPLVLRPDRPDPAFALRDDFDYDKDPLGVSCPPSAHIRVVNPRSQPIDAPDRPVPRLLRRGMPYGDPLSGTVDDNRERGLIGMFLCDSPRARFEKLMSWIKRNDFSDVFKGNRRAQDPLLGNRGLPSASTEFRIPVPGGEVKAVSLTTFVQPRGTAYFLLPGMSALRRFAGLA
jgi:deferrochelatase/peroxidase EfeB